jgi:TRAP-type uncharacterized transport system substrate-binding protein
VPVVGVDNVLVASAALDPALVETLTRVLFESKAALEAAHPEARHLSVPAGPDAVPVPLHDGARRYFDGRGWRE